MLYMLQEIPWTTNNIICLVLMGVAVWIASMIGYDKLLQLLKQIADVKTYNKVKDEVVETEVTPDGVKQKTVKEVKSDGQNTI